MGCEERALVFSAFLDMPHFFIVAGSVHGGGAALGLLALELPVLTCPVTFWVQPVDMLLLLCLGPGLGRLQTAAWPLRRICKLWEGLLYKGTGIVAERPHGVS